MVVLEAVGRLVPGVMGNEASGSDESFADGLLEYPQYTRPAEYRGWAVPDVLRSGDHARIARWRRAQSLARTARRRPDLIERRGGLSDEDRRLLDEFGEAAWAGRPAVIARTGLRDPFSRGRRSATIVVRPSAALSAPGETDAMKPTDIIDQASLRDDVPDFAPGDTLKVHVKVVEGNKERVQVFQGAVIRRQGGGLQETFTVRKLSYGVGVERTFPVHSPIIDHIELVSRGDVRRAKLYYQRDRIGKAAKIKEKRD